MGEYIPNEVLENKTVVRKYRELLQVVWPRTDAEERKQIRKAFKLATDAHYGVRRKSGEPYIYHPIAVAMICCSEMNLGATSVICALLHDVVEDTDYTLDDMRELSATWCPTSSTDSPKSTTLWWITRTSPCRPRTSKRYSSPCQRMCA